MLTNVKSAVLRALIRKFVAFYVALLTTVCFSQVESSARDGGSRYILFVGTYTTISNSKGIYAYRYDTKSPGLVSLGVAAETLNPSFLAVDRSHRFLYAVNEISEYEGARSGAVSAFAINLGSGRLLRLNEVTSHGADPCYISLDKTGKYAMVANYTGGNVAVFPILYDGRVGEISALAQHTGFGPDSERQEGPHAHWIETTSNNRFAIAADLGLDKLLIYRFDPTAGSLIPRPPAVKVHQGAGPRHLSFTPSQRFAYSINELQSTITAFSFEPRTAALRPFQTISALPKDFVGKNEAAEIHVHPNGKFLYASNRGHDSIAIFAIDKRNGRLTAIGDFSSEGKTPRTFEFDPSGSRLFVANQDSNSIVIFGVNKATGGLIPTGQILNVPAPVCLKFVVADVDSNEKADQSLRFASSR